MGMQETIAAAVGDEFQSSLRRVTLRLALLYWSANFVIDSLLWGVAGVNPIASATGKLINCTAGALMCFVISAVQFQFRDASLVARAAICFAAALLAAPASAILDFAYYAFCIWPTPPTFVWTDFGKTLISFTANYFGWSCLFLVLLNSAQMREQERRLAASREEALAAQMRALRYQINPHFLFNTLNSIAALIEETAHDRALKMVLSLSDFLHETLRLDPLHDVRLDDEVALQLNYLGIELERFPDRINLTTDIPEALRPALVPSLILQPLIENAIKHGVGAGPGMVEIYIRAAEADGALELSVENDVPLAVSAREGQWAGAGLGIGLSNVANRLQSRFPEDGVFSARLLAPDRFRAVLTMPLRIA